MSETTTSKSNDSRRERVADAGRTLDVVTAGMTAAGMGLLLGEDQAAARPNISPVSRSGTATAAQEHHDQAPVPETSHTAVQDGIVADPAQSTIYAPKPSSTAAASPSHGAINVDQSDHHVNDVVQAGDSAAGAAPSTEPAISPDRGAGSSPDVSHGGTSQLGTSDVDHTPIPLMAHVADTLHDAAAGLTQSVQQFGSALHDTVSHTIDTALASIHVPAITSSLSELPATLLGGVSDALGADGILANAFHVPEVAQPHAAVIAPALAPVTDIASFADHAASSLSLGFIGQSYVEHTEPGGHSLHGMLHGLV